MAGYIMTLGSGEYFNIFYSKKKNKKKLYNKEQAEVLAKQYALECCFRDGIYSARCSESGPAYLGTLADYLGMKSGDDIYFFKDRMIYGIGKLVDIAGFDCRFRVHAKNGKGKDLIDFVDPTVHPFVCTFVPDPFFFRIGVDMDEVLMRNPEKMKSLRFFSQRSFMKLDDFESKEIKNAIARKNEIYLSGYDPVAHYEFKEDVQKEVANTLSKYLEEYKLSVFDYIRYRGKTGNVTSEYFLEGAIMDLLRNYDSTSLGRWDFIGRQYPASPPKPSEYEEVMDLFGYRYVPGFPDAISKYIVIELKAGTINRDHVQQTMKYVDWISREYANGDYSMIQAYTVGYDKEQHVEEQTEDITERNYIIENRPVQNSKWHDLRILSYCQLLNELKDKETGDADE